MPIQLPKPSPGQALSAADLFAFMKGASNALELADRSLEIPGFPQVVMVPLGNLHIGLNRLAQRLLAMRKAFPDVFPDAAEISLESTLNWITDGLVANPDRLLFLLQSVDGDLLGHMGLYLRDGDRLELDNIVRAEGSGSPGVMASGLRALAAWALDQLAVEELHLQTLGSNTHARDWYSRLGLEEVTIMRDHWEVDESTVLYVWNAQTIRPNRETILTAGPSISCLERAATGDAVRNGWNSRSAEYLEMFETEMANYLGATNVLATDSCTSALHLALWTAGIGPGDEVIVPEITWVATATAVKYVGAEPVFADVDPVTWCLDPKDVVRKISDRTAAVIPVHLYGVVSDLGGLIDAMSGSSAVIIQDAAPAIGATYQGERISAFGLASCFSFQGAKLLVSGEGGALATRSQEFAARANRIRSYGRIPGTFWLEEFGKKMQMSNLTGALAVAQLSSVERQIAQKHRIRSWYEEDLEDLPIAFQSDSPGNKGISWMTSFALEGDHESARESLRDFLRERGIDTRPVFPPISQYPIWGKRSPANPVAERIGVAGINLPSGVALTRAEVAFVSSAIREWFERS